MRPLMNNVVYSPQF